MRLADILLPHFYFSIPFHHFFNSHLYHTWAIHYHLSSTVKDPFSQIDIRSDKDDGDSLKSSSKFKEMPDGMSHRPTLVLVGAAISTWTLDSLQLGLSKRLSCPLGIGKVLGTKISV